MLLGDNLNRHEGPLGRVLSLGVTLHSPGLDETVAVRAGINFRTMHVYGNGNTLAKRRRNDSLQLFG